jgi:frataxin-like iron-binding protein CyaY
MVVKPRKNRQCKMWRHSVLYEAQFIKNLSLSNNGPLKISPFNVSHGICNTLILFIFYVFCTRHIQVAKYNSQLTRKEAANKKKRKPTHLSQSVQKQVLALSIYNTVFIFLMQAPKTRVWVAFKRHSSGSLYFFWNGRNGVWEPG